MTVLDPIFVWVAQGLVALLFGASAVHKLRAPREFAEVLRDYRMLPDKLVGLAAPGIGCLEVAVAAGVWIPATRSVAAIGGAALLLLYATAIGWNLLRGRSEIDCGCTWGGTPQPLSGWLLVRNAILLVPCGLAVASRASRAPAVADVAVVLVAVIALSICYRAFETLLANLPAQRRLRGLA